MGSDISAQKGTSFCLVEELNDKEVQERLVKAGGGVSLVELVRNE